MDGFSTGFFHPASTHGCSYHGHVPRSSTINLDAVRFGAMLRALREQRGWTCRKLATRAGLTPTYVGIIEQGGNVPSLSTVLELVEVLGGDIGEIMRALAAARTAPPSGVRER
jgi:DNA-binding XRE family transcriptional regulator